MTPRFSAVFDCQARRPPYYGVATLPNAEATLWYDMVRQDCLLVLLLDMIDQMPVPMPIPTKATGKKGKGRPVVYSDRLFLKALVIMIVRRLHRVHELLAVLEQPTADMQRLRACLAEAGRYPSRRTFERRLAALPDTLPAQIGCAEWLSGTTFGERNPAVGAEGASRGDGQHCSACQRRRSLAQKG